MSFSEWREIKLGDLVDVSSSKRIYAKEYVDSGIPFYRSKEIIEKSKGNYVSTELYISKERFNELKNKFGAPSLGDILLTSVGTLGVPYIVRKEEFYFKDGNLTWIKNFKDNCHNKFIFYWLLSPDGVNQINTRCIGSTQKALTIDTLKKFELKIPPYEEQKAIARILSTLDEKIEVNNQINKTLENMAQAIFKQWFVDFEFPNEDGEPYKSSGGEMVESELGMIPKGWEVKGLDETADYLNGLAMQKFRPEENEKEYPVLKIKELRQGFTDSSSDVCSVNIDKKYIIHDGDIIFSWSGSLLVDIWCGGTCGLNQHLFKVTSKEYDKWFYYHWTEYHLKRFVEIAASKATTMGHIKRKDLSDSKVAIPSKQTYDKASQVFKPLFDKITGTKIESKRLAEIRDALLPKLMSGEIRVPLDEEGEVS